MTKAKSQGRQLISMMKRRWMTYSEMLDTRISLSPQKGLDMRRITPVPAHKVRRRELERAAFMALIRRVSRKAEHPHEPSPADALATTPETGDTEGGSPD